jgi:hypothetical protein
MHVSERVRAYRRQVLMRPILELQADGCTNSEIAAELNRRSVPGIRTTAPWTGARIALIRRSIAADVDAIAGDREARRTPNVATR